MFSPWARKQPPSSSSEGISVGQAMLAVASRQVSSSALPISRPHLANGHNISSVATFFLNAAVAQLGHSGSQSVRSKGSRKTRRQCLLSRQRTMDSTPVQRNRRGAMAAGSLLEIIAGGEALPPPQFQGCLWSSNDRGYGVLLASQRELGKTQNYVK